MFGEHTPVQRCVRHKERNVLEHLPERDRPPLKRRLRQAWADPDHNRGLRALQALAVELERSHPGAASSLREGIEQDAHPHPPRRPRPAEAHARIDQSLRVDDRMRPAHQPQRQALAVRRDVPTLDRRRHARSRASVPADHRLPRSRQARHRDRARPQPPPARSAPTPRARRPLSSSPPDHHTGTAATKFHGDRDILLWRAAIFQACCANLCL